jgi:hypothetical protein
LLGCWSGENMATAKPNTELSVTARMFKNFYRDHYKYLALSSFIITLLNIACVIIIVYLLVFDKPSDVYISAEISSANSSIPAESAFSITPRIPIDRTNMTQSQLEQWLIDAIHSSFSYDVQFYAKQLAANKNFYTSQGWAQYKDILEGFVKLDTYTLKDTIISLLHPSSAPELHQHGVINGRYVWIFDFPVQLEFIGTVSFPVYTMTLRVQVERTSMENDVYGIKIAGMQALDVRQRATLSGFNDLNLVR